MTAIDPLDYYDPIDIEDVERVNEIMDDVLSDYSIEQRVLFLLVRARKLHSDIDEPQFDFIDLTIAADRISNSSNP